MSVHQHHAAVSRDPVELANPDTRLLLSQQNEHGVVLGQGVWELNIAARRRTVDSWFLTRRCGSLRSNPRTANASGGMGNPEREDGAHAARLRFEGVGVKSRRLVKDVQLMGPFQVVEHKTRA